MNIDPVHEGTGDLGAVALNLGDGALAFIVGISIITAGAGVHGRQEHEAGRVGEGSRGAGDGYSLFFQRLAHHLQDIFSEFGELIQK